MLIFDPTFIYTYIYTYTSLYIRIYTYILERELVRKQKRKTIRISFKFFIRALSRLPAFWFERRTRMRVPPEFTVPRDLATSTLSRTLFRVRSSVCHRTSQGMVRFFTLAGSYVSAFLRLRLWARAKLSWFFVPFGE